MNVEIGAEAALFPEKEYISGIFVAVQEHKSIGADFSQRSSRRYQRSSKDEYCINTVDRKLQK